MPCKFFGATRYYQTTSDACWGSWEIGDSNHGQKWVIFLRCSRDQWVNWEHDKIGVGHIFIYIAKISHNMTSNDIYSGFWKITHVCLTHWGLVRPIGVTMIYLQKVFFLWYTIQLFTTIMVTVGQETQLDFDFFLRFSLFDI